MVKQDYNRSMIDIQYIRDNPARVKEFSRQKGYDVDIDALLRVDQDRKTLLADVEGLRQRRNEVAARMKGGKPSQTDIDEGKQIKIELAGREDLLSQTEAEWTVLLKKVPNIPFDDVPVGSSEDDNVIAKTVGELPKFDFEPKNHAAIAEAKGWLDKERAAKVAGSRFAYLKGDLVQLQFAIIQFTLERLTDESFIARLVSEHGLSVKPTSFTPILPPVLIREDIYDQMDRLEPREDRYHIDGDDDNLWLIGSAEHTMGSMYAEEVLDGSMLPMRYIGYSTSFRQEAGTYGKDSEGIFRVHQFDKLEMEVFSTAETGLEEHRLLIAIQESLMQELKLPYQLVQKCTADIGKPNARGVDINVWLPGQGTYRETHTADYMTDYQARRLRTRYRHASGATAFVHTNDATAFAMGRTMIAIVENYQTADGDVRVPDALKPIMGGKELI